VAEAGFVGRLKRNREKYRRRHKMEGRAVEQCKENEGKNQGKLTATDEENGEKRPQESLLKREDFREKAG